MTDLKPNQGARGFCSFDAIRADRGTTVKLYESSSAQEARVYLHLAEQPSFGDPSGREIAAAMSLEALQLLRDQCDWFLTNHYMVRG